MRALVAIATESGEDRLRWTEDDLAGVWPQYLATSIVTDAGDMGGVAALQASELVARHPPPSPQTFRELLKHPTPSPALLELSQRLLLHRLSDPDAALPHDIHRALHALLYLAQRLRAETGALSAPTASGLTDTELRRRAEWITKQPWIDDDSKSLAGEASTLR